MFDTLISAATYSLAVDKLSADFLKLFLHTLHILMFLIEQLESANFMCLLCIYVSSALLEKGCIFLHPPMCV